MTDNITLPRAVGEQVRLFMACYDKFLNTDDVFALDALAAALAEPEQGNCADGSCGCCWTDKPDAKREPYNLAELFAQFAAKQRPLDADMAAIINANLDSLYITDEPAAALAEPEQKPEPVAFAKNGNLFWCGDASQMRGVDIDLYLAPPQPDAKREPVHPGYVIGSHWLETAYSRIAAGEAEADVLAEVLGERGWTKPEPATDEQIAEADENHAPSWLDYRDGWRDAERFHGIRKEDGK